MSPFHIRRPGDTSPEPAISQFSLSLAIPDPSDSSFSIQASSYGKQDDAIAAGRRKIQVLVVLGFADFKDACEPRPCKSALHFTHSCGSAALRFAAVLTAWQPEEMGHVPLADRSGGTS